MSRAGQQKLAKVDGCHEKRLRARPYDSYIALKTGTCATSHSQHASLLSPSLRTSGMFNVSKKNLHTLV